MFRITNLALNGRILLHRCRSIEIQVVSVSRLPPLRQKYKPKARETCPPPPPPPPPKPPDERLLWGTITLFVLAGGFAMYAKESPEVRDWLSMNLPWFDDLIAILYQENMTFKEFAMKCINDIKEYKTNSKEESSKPKECNLDGKPVAEPPKEKTVVIESGPETGEICKIIPPPVTTRDVCEVVKCLEEFCEIIVNNYITAKDACAYYNREVEEAMQKFTIKKMTKLHETKAERIELVETSLENVNVTAAKLEELTHYFECGVQAPKEKLDQTRTLIKDCSDKIKIVEAQYKWENDRSIALDDLWTRVESLIQKYTEEMITLVPGVGYDETKKVPVLQGDPDLMAFHTYRYVTQLEATLAEVSSGMTARVKRAMGALTPVPEKEEEARICMITASLAERSKEVDKAYNTVLKNLKAALDQALRDALKKQLERHNETMEIKLKQKEKDTTVKLNKLVADKVAEEKRHFKNELEEMARKLKIVEDKLKERLKAERETRRSQELWTAGASLLAATKKGDPIVKVDREIKAIEKASGDGDKLVETVLKAIPDTVKENGIVPESVLRERYQTMETVAMRVALVEAEGALLPVYLLSFLQSIFLFMKLSGIPQEEIEKPPLEPTKDLDTFDLLQRARFWMQRGNLAIALRYVDALQGASRAAAAWWYEAARAHLETRQAAEAVLAHAAALGLQYI